MHSVVVSGELFPHTGVSWGQAWDPIHICFPSTYMEGVQTKHDYTAGLEHLSEKLVVIAGSCMRSSLAWGEQSTTQQGQSQARDQAQWLRALLLLPRTGILLPVSTWRLTTLCNSSPREPEALLWLPQVVHAHGA